MNSLILKNIVRFIGLVAIQVLVLKQIYFQAPVLKHVFVIIYPIFILLLPLRTANVLVIFLGFALGIVIDAFYDSLGIHASACVFTAFLRPYILTFLEPRGGYNINQSPTKYRFGIGWFLRYSSILMLLHLFFYFSVEAFTFVYIGTILLRTGLSFVFSMFFVLVYQYIFNPKD